MARFCVCSGCWRERKGWRKAALCKACLGAQNRILVPCPRCETPFWPWAKGDHARKFCSRACAYPNAGKPKAAKRSVLTEAERKARAKERSRCYYQAHRAHAMSTKNKYRLRQRQDPVYRAMERACTTRWGKKHPDRLRHIRQRTRMTRRARKRGRFVEVVDRRKVYAQASGICGICHHSIRFEEDWHVDHIVPLARGGEHSYVNTQPAHARCNVMKGDTPAPLGPSYVPAMRVHGAQDRGRQSR